MWRMLFVHLKLSVVVDDYACMYVLTLIYNRILMVSRQLEDIDINGDGFSISTRVTSYPMRNVHFIYVWSHFICPIIRMSSTYKNIIYCRTHYHTFLIVGLLGHTFSK